MRIGALCTGFVLATCLTLLASTNTLSARQNLPQIGEPADAALSPAAEREIGKNFMRQIRAQVPVVRDIQIAEYLDAMGARLSANVADSDTHEFTFFIIENPLINAFAIPGGYIGLNSGLIEAMNVEDQLAGVIGHEIAHITQRHHARSVASSGRSRLTTAAAILAAIIIGQSSPQAAQAALAAGIAASQQSLINFTRSNEFEADRIGIEILAQAAYKPEAMAEAFEILRRKNNLNIGSNNLQYLRTHPLDNIRIAEAKNRAVALKHDNHIDTRVEFAIFKARNRVLTTKDKGQLERNYRAIKNSPKLELQVEANYALTMLDLDKRRFDAALQKIEPLLEKYPDNLNLQLLASRAWFRAGQSTKSAERLDLLSNVYPENYSVYSMQIEHYIESRQPEKAHAVLRSYLRSNNIPNSFAWRDLANIEQQRGKTSASHEALARFFTELDELGRARAQLALALREVDSDTSDALRLKAKLRELDSEIKRYNK